jgi:hypothetical protein
MTNRAFRAYVRRVTKAALEGKRDAIRTLGALTLALTKLHEPHRHCRRAS